MKLGIGLSLSLPRTAGVGGPPYPRTFTAVLSNPTGGLTISKASGTCVINYIGQLNPIITASRTSGSGPLFVMFDALASQVSPSLSSMPFFEVFYDWDFGDSVAAGQTWGYGTKAGTASRNTAFGPVVAHVFDEGNSYTVTLRARYRGIAGVLTTKTTTIVVTVTAADVAFSSTTLCVSNTALPVAGVGGVPAGAACQLVTSWSALSSLSSTYKRILLKAGESWNTDGTASLSPGPGLFGKYGTGSNPLITVVSNNPVFYMNGSSDWRILDMNLTGDGIQGNSKRFIVGGSGFHGAGGDYLIQRVEINDTLVGIGFGNTNHVGLVDCYIHDAYDASQAMGGICVYNSSVTSFAAMGCRFSRSPATHVVRLQGTARTFISNNVFESAGGERNALTIRGMAGTVYDGNGYVIWSGKWTENVVVSDNIIDNSQVVNGGYAFYCGPQAIGHAERCRNVIFERNFCAGKAAQAANFQVVSGLVVRGNIFSSSYASTVGLGLGGNVAGSPATTSAYFWNNTFYKPDTAATSSYSPFFLSNAGLGSGLELVNNIMYGAGNNRDGSGNGTAATQYVQGGTAGDPGVNFTLTNNSTDAQINSTRPWAVTTPTTYASYAVSAYGVDAGVFVPMFSDFFNYEITGTRDMGAIQV